MTGNLNATTPLQSFPTPISTDDPDVTADTYTLATAIEKRVMGVYNNATDRDARITSPQEGQFAYLKDTDLVWRYTGSAWTLFPPAAPSITSGTTTPSNGTGANGDIYFKY